MVAAYDYVKSKGILEHHFAEVGHRSSPYGPTLSPPNLFPLGQSPKSTRQAVQHQCKGNAVYGAKGIAAPEGWWLYYSQLFSTAPSRVLRVLPPSASTPRVRLLSALS